MPEPASGAYAGVTITVGTVSMVGTVFGMSYDSLLFGLFGTLIMLSRPGVVPRSQALTSVVAGVLLAGAFSPILASIAISYFTSLERAGEDAVRKACAILIGGGWQHVVPAAWSVIQEKFLGKIAEPKK